MDDQEGQMPPEGGSNNDVIKDKPDLIDEDDPTRLVRTEVRKGSLLGNERVRVVLPSQRAFRRIGTGRLEATEVTQAPRKGIGRVISNVKRAFIGAPIATAQAEHEQLTKFKALAVLSSDAISSVERTARALNFVSRSCSAWAVAMGAPMKTRLTLEITLPIPLRGACVTSVASNLPVPMRRNARWLGSTTRTRSFPSKLPLRTSVRTNRVGSSSSIRSGLSLITSLLLPPSGGI